MILSAAGLSGSGQEESMNTLPNKLFKRSAVIALLFALLFCIGCNTVTTPNGTSEAYGNRLMLATNNTAFYYDGIWTANSYPTEP